MGYRDEECKGCFAAVKPGQGIYACRMLPRYKSLECPCLTCIVKGVCRNDCESVKDYFAKTQIYREVPYE